MDEHKDAPNYGASKHICDATQRSESQIVIDLAPLNVNKEALRQYIIDFNRRARGMPSDKDDLRRHLMGLIDSMGMSVIEIAALLIPTGMEYLVVGLQCEDYLSKNDLRTSEIDMVIDIVRKGGL